MRRFTLPFLILAAALALVACGSGATTSTPGASAPASAEASQPAGSDAPAAACVPAPAGATPTVNVEIKDFAFSPDPVEAKVGDVVAWTNADSASHTSSLTDGSCTTESISKGATGALVFNAAGIYEYQCNIHPGQMKGYTIEVK